MFAFPPAFLNSAAASCYFNGFAVNAALGRLTVPRLLIYDDIDPRYPIISRPTFREHEAVEVAEELEDVFGHLRDRFSRSPSPSGERLLSLGSWRIRHPFEDLITAEGPGGRSIQVQSGPGNLTLKVGYASQAREDREAHLSVTIQRGQGEPKFQSSYSFGFGEKSYAGLLEFLGLERPPVCLEWMSRRSLWDALRGRLEASDIKTDGYDGDHLGLYWKMSHPHGDRSSGRLWTDDAYPALEFHFPWFPDSLPSAFLPLWEDTVIRVRSAAGRSSSRLPASRLAPSESSA